MFANGLNSVIRADGSPRFAMISTLVGCMINVIFDPIAIFVFHWGLEVLQSQQSQVRLYPQD